MAILQAINLKKTYHLQKLSIEVLKGVDISVNKGELVAVVGPSGAGKSTLLHILGALDRPTIGQVLIDGEDVFSRNETELAQFRNKTIGFVFQFHHLLPEFTALENVLIPGMIARKPKSTLIDSATSLLTRIGLAHRLHHKPGELSGGEQQRVAIARALINSPKLILADEPSGNLDRKNAQSLHELMAHLSESEHITFIIVTHNEELAKISHKLLHIKDGKAFLE